jgi:uncharacterized tellurite resistance protein B-like protein
MPYTDTKVAVMMDFIRKIIGSPPADSGTREHTSGLDDVRVAMCALLLEMAHSDGEFSDSERTYVAEILRREFDLSDESTGELMAEARRQLDESTSLWRFTNVLNQNVSKDYRLQVVEMIWRLIYADGRLSHHENYLVHKFQKMLRLTHRELIDAKLRVLHGS